MGILQGSSTQTDYVSSFWLTVFVLFFMRLRKDQRSLYVVGTGGALGLALLTKATAYIYAFPFLLWLGMPSLLKGRIRYWKTAVMVLIIAVGINALHYSRNAATYGHPLGDTDHKGESYSNEVISVPSVISNLIRNLSPHLSTQSLTVNKTIERWINHIHKTIGIDSSDPRTTMFNLKFLVKKLIFSEDISGNTHHLLLILVTIGIVLFSRNMENRAELIAYTVATGMVFFLFCAALKWQPWHSRLHLPVFVLYAPLAGTALSKIKYGRVAKMIVIAMIIASIPWIVFNRNKPLIGKRTIFNTNKIDQYFTGLRIQKPYMLASKFTTDLRGCHVAGLILEEDNWEYPFWVLLNQGKSFVRIFHVNVGNHTNRLQPEIDEQPCVVISTLPLATKQITVGNVKYSRKACFDNVCVWLMVE